MDHPTITTKKKQTFDALNVPLRGSNLVEASAGTGKTYSLAILALRLLLEKNEQGKFRELKEILLITFTNNAVAELKVRVRLFIQKALTYAQKYNSESEEDGNIRTIVDRAVEKDSSREEIVERLQKALLNFDEASIQTIHSFCWQTVRDNALESGVSFSVEMNQDTKEIRQKFLHEFIREEISMMDVKVLSYLNIEKVYDHLKSAFEKLASGSNFQIHDHEALSPEEAVAQFELHKNALQSEIIAQADVLQTLLTQKTLKYLEPLSKVASDIPANLSVFFTYSDYKKLFFTKEGYHEIWERIVNFKASSELLEKEILESTVQSLAQKAYPKYLEHLKNAEIFTFDTIITSLKESLIERDNQQLIRKVRQKYTAVFIDEFQDTDRTQAAIIEKLFIPENQEAYNALLFLIGDPKQSIYAFRNADVTSYLAVRNKMQHHYTMTTNYRSSAELIDAVNTLYEKVGLQESFGFENHDEQDSISYEKVDAAKTNISLEGMESALINFYQCKNQSNILELLTNQVSSLLDKESTVRFKKVNEDGTIERRKVKPSDIGVLVLKNDHAKEIKSALAKKGITAVISSDEKITATSEASELLLLLEAMRNPTEQSIKKALFATFLVDTRTEEGNENWILDINIEQAFLLFSNYKALLAENNIYQALYRVLEDFSLRQRFSQNPHRLRQLANIEQLMQILQEKQYQTNWNADEAIRWLADEIEDGPSNNTEYELKLETDRESLTISTIHKAKGLEYPIVFMHNTVSEPRSEKSFVDVNLNEKKLFYVNGRESTEIKEESIKQAQQEFLRIWYVAITRPVFLCNIIYSNHTLNKKFNYSFFEAAKNLSNEKGPISWQTVDEIPSDTFDLDHSIADTTTAVTFDESKAKKARSFWHYTSFSKLSQYSGVTEFTSVDLSDPYDIFVLKTLGSGATFGSVMHSIFEHLDFSQDFSDYHTLDNSLKKRIRYLLNKEDESYLQLGAQLIQNVVQAVIPAHTPFRMSEVEMNRCIPELTFYFHIDRAQNIPKLKKLLEGKAHINFHDDTLRGMMDGAIDLFFEHNGKYYILDWKSNLLGFDPALYEGEKLSQAMFHHNYTLQYYIYTVAACRFIKSKKPDFDYERDFGGAIYLFVRGNRAGTSSGVYFDKPDANFVQELMNLL